MKPLLTPFERRYMKLAIVYLWMTPLYFYLLLSFFITTDMDLLTIKPAAYAISLLVTILIPNVVAIYVIRKDEDDHKRFVNAIPFIALISPPHAGVRMIITIVVTLLMRTANIEWHRRELPYVFRPCRSLYEGHYYQEKED